MIRTLAITLAFAAAGAAATAQPISIGTNPQGSLAYAAGSVIADVVGDALGETFTVVPLGGPTALIPAMNDGEFEFSFANITAAADALEGRGAFDGRAQPDTRIAAALYPLRLGIIVRDDSGIESLADLRGRRIAAEFSSQRNLAHYVTTLLGMAGMTYDDVSPVPVQSGAQSLDDLIDGQLDATIFSVGSGIVQRADASVGIRILSLPADDDALAALAASHGGATIEALPDGHAAGIEGETNVISAPMVLITSATTPDETVVRVIQAISENLPSLVKGQSNFAGMSVEGMADSTLPVPYHAAAQAYYAEAGLWN
ncbi:MAG: TAXI family TRAP transporter solute-binding subunit [Marivita sp.]|uniref:TAXI family TRAP transporter solute-binding subunit n=1 Tax=Marivita sp. TaxID=2003365 RepID=UPI0025C68012|nr:TAXI family TRAP transporter solute-binding subunit [Marivita sp.]MCI5112295.1 TAXI family TRAP transporter solute-binding subunit [Marivita sp.]